MAINLTGKMYVQTRENGFTPTVIEVCPHPHDGVHVGQPLTLGCPDCYRVSREALAKVAATGDAAQIEMAKDISEITPGALDGFTGFRPLFEKNGGQDAALATVKAADLGRKFEIEDVTADLQKAAATWLKAYTGDFEFLLDVRKSAASRGLLSKGQAKGVLNCMRAEIARLGRRVAEASAPVASGKLDFNSIPDARYAVEHDGEIAYYVISTSKNGSGKRHVCILASDERIYVGTILASGEYRGKHESLLRAVIGNPEAAALLFGQTIGKCCRCGRTLTDASSRAAGIGPECAGKGW